MIVLHQEAIDYLARNYPQATVLTAWPVTTELYCPELGYTKRPIKAVAIENFSADDIRKAAQQPVAFDTVLVVTTNYIAPALRRSPGRSTRTDARCCDFHEARCSRRGDRRRAWRRRRLAGRANGEWAAIVRLQRARTTAPIAIPRSPL